MEWKDIKGVDEPKKRLDSLVLDPVAKGAFHLWPKGILLFGPSGAGKTHLIRALIDETRDKVMVIEISGAEIKLSESIESVKTKIDRLFERARSKQPSVIYFDRIESFDMFLQSATSGIASYFQQYLAGKLQEVKDSQVLVIAETNHPNRIDDLLLRSDRLEDVIYVRMPKDTERKDILVALLEDFSADQIAELEPMTKGFNRAEFGAFVREAQRVARQAGRELSVKDFKEAKTGFSYFVDHSSIAECDYFWRRFGTETANIEEGLTWDSVVGLEDAKREFKRIIAVIEKPQLCDEFGVTIPNGILFYGPPGCGKTLIAKVAAREVKANFIYMSAVDLKVMWFGESKEKVKKLFVEAERKFPSMIFLDELDAIGTRETDIMGGRSEIIAQLLFELDGIKKNRNILFCAATNLPWSIDPALIRPGRIDKEIYIPPPNREARVALFKMYLKSKHLGKVDFEQLADRTEGYSAADVRNICVKAMDANLDEFLKTDKTSDIDTDDCLALIRKEKPSLSPEVSKMYENYKVVKVKEDLKHYA